MGRKVFISVLGATNYRSCDYQKEGVSYGCERFVQVSTMKYLNCASWSEDSIAYILLTKGSEDNNWVDDGQIDIKTKERIKQSGLKTDLERMHLPFSIEAISNLPDGNSETEIWEIFERVFSKIQDNDELYFDITHGFRYLPMLILVLCNYSKFLKNVIIKSITYGNYEVSRELGHGLIVDLLPLAQLQDWTYAAGQYLDSGNVERLVKLSNEELQPILRESNGGNENAKTLKTFVKYLGQAIEDLKLCRGINIVKSENINTVIETADKLESTFITPLDPIFRKIKESFKGFDKNENFKNGFAAAKWCLENGLYQQAATIVQENIVTMVCIEMDFDWTQEDSRNIVDIAFKVKKDNIEEKNWILKLSANANDEVKKKRIKDIKQTIENDLFNDFVDVFSRLKGLRNDINHSGMRNNPAVSKNLKSGIEECINNILVKSC